MVSAVAVVVLVLVQHTYFTRRTAAQSLIFMAMITPLLTATAAQFAPVPGRALGAALVIAAIVAYVEGTYHANRI